MNNLKRFLALVLAMSMMLTVVPFGALAADGDATHLATRPVDSTVTGEPFDTTVSKNYRIPGLVNHNGTLIASADARWDYEKDGGGMDLVVSRSTDGNTWNYTFAGYLGDNGNAWNANSSTLMDPVIISDGTTLYLLADIFPAGYSISDSSTANVFSETVTGFDGSGNLLLSSDDRANYDHYLKDGKVLTADGAETGYTVDGWFDLYENGTYVSNLFFADSPLQVQPTSFICMSTSTDGGVTWNDPTLVNAKPSGVSWMVLGPGSGLVTKDGYVAFTAYDGSNIYLITGKDGVWNRVETSAASNESSIIELNDGTIRAFVKRAGSNTIAYVDFTRTAAGTYTAGNLVDTGVTNFSQCMVSSLHYSKTLNSKEVVLVCCPSKPGSGAWNGRFNGKIHMFTLDSSNNMTLVSSYALNGESEFFAYSNMAELNDGTVGVLYEDDCLSYSAGNYTGNASHITYKNVNLATVFGVTFDSMQTNEKSDVDVTLEIGQTVTNTITGAAYEECTTDPNTDVATVTVEADGDVVAYGELKDTTHNGTRVTLADCEYTFTGSAGAWNATIAKDGSTWYVKPNSKGHSTDSATLTLTFNDNGSVYLKDSSHYLYVNRNTLAWDRTSTSSGYETHVTFYLYGEGEDADSAIPGYKLITAEDQITSGEGYLIAFYDANGQLYVMNPTTRTASAYNQMAAVATALENPTTTVTITGVGFGNTVAVVGNTTYNISVKGNGKAISMFVGQSVTDTIEGTGYTMADANVVDTSVATIDKVETISVPGTTEMAVSTTKATALEAGATYILRVFDTTYALSSNAGRGNWGTTTLAFESNTLTANTDHLWMLEAADGGYKLKNEDGYLNLGTGNNSAYLNETGEVFTFTSTDTGWTICNPSGRYINALGGLTSYYTAGGWTGDGTRFDLYKVDITTSSTTSTEVTFTGVKIGTTTATVGNVKYDITVGQEVRDITVTVGQSVTDTIEGFAYTMDNAKVEDTSVATVDKVESTTVAADKELVAVTEIVSGKQYIIVNKRAGTEGSAAPDLENSVLTATANGNSLHMNGPVSEECTELWTITEATGGYTVMRNGKYLTIGDDTSAVVSEENVLNVSYTSSGWTIEEDGYYLSDKYGTNSENAHGYGTAGDGGNYWIIYEVVATASVSSTDVTFTGVKVGTTTASVGHVNYNITVAADVRDIKLHVNQTKTFYIDGSSYTEGSIADSATATLDSVVPANAKLVPVSEIVSEGEYLIVNSQTGEVLTNTPITLTGDAGEKSALVTEGTASVTNTELWTITGSADTGYTVVQDEQYLTVAGYYAAMSDTETYLKLTYSNSGWMICDDTTWESLDHTEADYYLRNGIADANYTTDAMGSSITSSYSYWNIYKIESSPVTEVTFTGVKAGSTTATVGHVTFNITVDNVSAGNIADFNNIVGVDSYSDDNANETYRSDLDMAGKVITSLRITEGASFHLGVDVTGYESVTWTTVDPSIATVDADGNVTAVAEGETYVTATVVKGSVEESISIPVIVVPSMVEGYADSAVTTVFYYIENIVYTDPYYTMFLSTENASGPVAGHEMVKVSEGEVIWYERPTDSAFAWVWTADPWEGYALTLMTSTGSVGEYYPLKNPDADGVELGSGTVNGTQYYVGNNAYNNVVNVGNDDGASWTTALNNLLEEAILVGINVYPNYGCDGAMSNTRWDHDGVPKLVTSMTFISDPMPHIEKTVNGILPTTRLRKDFRPYEDGMTATVHEYVYFQITITLDRPTVWEDEANGIGAINYTNAIVLDDDLAGGYFYVQADDANLDGVIDSSEGEQLQSEDITARLNAAWGANEQTRTIDLYLIYEIREDDIPYYAIDNTADLTWAYQSEYSTGALAGKANAKATITVVGYPMDNAVIDFGQTITYSGLTDAHLKYVTLGTHTTKYGTAVVTADGDVQYDAKNNPYYNSYTVTYTPNTILQAPDAVQLEGTYTDLQTGEEVTKVINGFAVYPATTVYYEEGFMFDYTNADAGNNTMWVTTNTAKATMEQKFERLSKAVYDDEGTLTGFETDKTYAYGYDPIYDEMSGASNGTQATASVAGAVTTFTFTGTGFDLYANCTEETGSVAVQVKDAAGKAVAMYTVNTEVGEAFTDKVDSTDGQSGSMYSLPIISEQGLAHGTYTVKVMKIMNDNKSVNLDGIRIFNAFDESPYLAEDSKADSPFEIDLEDAPEFYQLRDYVLSALNVSNIVTRENGTQVKLADQIYAQISSDSEAPYAAVLANGNYNNDVQNLLDNGPKNELYLHAGETLVFSVKTSRAMQIGLKAPAGETSYSISGATANGISGTMKTTVDMFYALGNAIGTETTYTITVTNTGSNILAVTDLKICDDPNAAFVALSAEDIETALNVMGYSDSCEDGHTYVDGFCSVCGIGTARNTTTGDEYGTVADALNAAQEGETVILLTDCTADNIMVTQGITLDLNGCELTAAYMVTFGSAHVIDSVGGGSLITDEKNLVLNAANAMLPVYNGSAYVFTRAGFAIRQDTSYTGNGIRINAMAYPMDMGVVELLKDGSADNNIDIVIRFSWDTADGTGSQEFKFNDDVVASVYSSNGGDWTSYNMMFAMTITGFESITNLKAHVVMVSDTHVEYVSSNAVDIT